MRQPRLFGGVEHARSLRALVQRSSRPRVRCEVGGVTTRTGPRDWSYVRGRHGFSKIRGSKGFAYESRGKFYARVTIAAQKRKEVLGSPWCTSLDAARERAHVLQAPDVMRSAKSRHRSGHTTLSMLRRYERDVRRWRELGEGAPRCRRRRDRASPTRTCRQTCRQTQNRSPRNHVTIEKCAGGELNPYALRQQNLKSAASASFATRARDFCPIPIRFFRFPWGP